MGSAIGLISSLVALAMGCGFFAYAAKYYGSSLIALSGLGRASAEEEKPDDGETLPMISIHLPFYNEANVARRILRACLEIDYPRFEVIVADDSRDTTVEILREAGWRRKLPIVKFVHRGDRIGFKGGALSEAVRLTNPVAEFVAIFDADFVPPGDILRRFVAFYRESDEAGDKPVAAVQGYQLHYLNKSENWVTRGVRAEFSGSYMVERVAAEKVGALKMVSGSVFMLRADVLRRLGWGRSITEDWELTLRLYIDGYRVAYTPLIQAPAEIPVSLGALARQRMRWAEGHTHSVRKYFIAVLTSAKLTTMEKLEFLYFAPYYLQSLMLLIGSACWIVAEVNHVYPWFWRPAFGWGLLVSNLLAAPVMCLTGLFLEGDLRSDYSGAFGLVALTYLLAPYQGYAALKGLLEREEGGWIRTLKTGSVTDRFLKLKLRWLLRWLKPAERLGRLSLGELSLPSVPGFARWSLAVASLGLMSLPLVALVVA